MSRPSFRRGLKAVAADYCQLSNSPSTRKDDSNPTFLMKPIPIPLALLAALATTVLVHAQDKPTTDSPVTSTTARILGEIPDGTPPPPESPKPKFIVPAKDILETTTHQQGGRTITVRKINLIPLPPPPQVAPPLDINDPAIQERIAEAREEHPADEFLCAGASVFRPKDSRPLSLVHTWPQGRGEPVVFWSSADFALISGIGNFIGSDGGTRSLFLMWGVSEIETRTALQNELGPESPQIPDFPAGKATFHIVSGNPGKQTLASIQSLHDLYNSEYDRLKTACEGRERAQREHEAELKANPPKPKDIILNYWRTEKPAAEKGVAR